jgi:thiol-disulfide isomerase/thioredoxin
MSVITITSQGHIDKLGGIVVLNFWADWSKQCEQTNDVFQKLAQKYPTVHFAQIEAEKVPDVSEKYSVLSVPYFVFLRVSYICFVFKYKTCYFSLILKGGAVIDQLEGANIPALNEKVVKYSKEAGNSMS